jgi:hypothetical protein
MTCTYCGEQTETEWAPGTLAYCNQCEKDGSANYDRADRALAREGTAEARVARDAAWSVAEAHATALYAGDIVTVRRYVRGEGFTGRATMRVVNPEYPDSVGRSFTGDDLDGRFMGKRHAETYANIVDVVRAEMCLDR